MNFNYGMSPVTVVSILRMIFMIYIFLLYEAVQFFWMKCCDLQAREGHRTFLDIPAPADVSKELDSNFSIFISIVHLYRGT